MLSIVTGSSGFIGSRLSYLLEKEGCDVVGVSRHMQSRERDVKCDLEKDCLKEEVFKEVNSCLLYTSPSPRDAESSRMPSSA